MNKSDFTYTESYPWIKLFPNNEKAEEVWRDFCKENNCDAFTVLVVHWAGCKMALKKAGYTVKKAKKATQSEIDKMYDELDAMYPELSEEVV
jgi:pyruvate-formate lyase-activating enzyme